MFLRLFTYVSPPLWTNGKLHFPILIDCSYKQTESLSILRGKQIIFNWFSRCLCEKEREVPRAMSQQFDIEVKKVIKVLKTKERINIQVAVPIPVAVLFKSHEICSN